MMFVMYFESLVVFSYASMAALKSRFSLAASLYNSSLYRVSHEMTSTSRYNVQWKTIFIIDVVLVSTDLVESDSLILLGQRRQRRLFG